jgi:(2Fe-2S) ferredoxin
VSSCSVISLALGEPLFGTAPYAPRWLLVEHPGPWGRKAVAEAGLRELEARGKELGVRVGLVRRFGRPSSRGPRRIFLVSCEPPEPSVELLSEPDLAARGERVEGPLYLVCTNGRRDVCCGRAGRELGRELAPELGGRLWETTHIGGHRFAPNLVCLPHGVVYGRLDAATARRVVRAYEAGLVELEHLRGRTSLEPEAQARDWFARRLTGRLRLDDNPADEVPVVVAGVPLEPPRPESCGGEPKQPLAWRLVSPEPERG